DGDGVAGADRDLELGPVGHGDAECLQALQLDGQGEHAFGGEVWVHDRGGVAGAGGGAQLLGGGEAQAGGRTAEDQLLVHHGDAEDVAELLAGVRGAVVGGPKGRGLQGVVDVLGEGVASRVVRGRALGDADGDGGAAVHGQGEGGVGGELAVGR